MEEVLNLMQGLTKLGISKKCCSKNIANEKYRLNLNLLKYEAKADFPFLTIHSKKDIVHIYQPIKLEQTLFPVPELKEW